MKNVALTQLYQTVKNQGHATHRSKNIEREKIRQILPSQIFLNNEKFVVQIENFFEKWNL